MHPVDTDSIKNQDYKASARIQRQQSGIDFSQLEELTKLYAVDTTSGLGGVESYTISPDKLAGSGFLIDYITFLNDIQIEQNEFIPSVPEKERVAAQVVLACPDPAQVYFKIAD